MKNIDIVREKEKVVNNNTKKKNCYIFIQKFLFLFNINTLKNGLK
jgi:hypothetical protein